MGLFWDIHKYIYIYIHRIYCQCRWIGLRDTFTGKKTCLVGTTMIPVDFRLNKAIDSGGWIWNIMGVYEI